MNEHEPAMAPDEPPRPGEPRTLLPWPPPGLERVQGDLWRVTMKLAAGGAVMTLPMLWATAARTPIGSTGPFSDAWWVLVLCALVGLGILTTGFVDAFRLLRRMGGAVRRGYVPGLVALVAVDQGRDAGFLVQGARVYSELADEVRNALRIVRVGAALSYAAGALWLSLGFALGLLLAAGNALSPGGLAAFVLVPTATLFLVGLLARSWDNIVMRRARRRWHRQPWSADLAGTDVDEWQHEAQQDAGFNAPVTDHGSARAFRIGAAGVVLAALLVLLPVLSLVVTSSVSPVLAMIAAPNVLQTQERAAAAEPLRRYVLPPDPAIGAEEAGHMLQVIAYAGSTRAPDPLEREPIRRYARPWIAEPNPTGAHPAHWAERLLPGIRDAEPDVRAFIAEVASHPAQAEIQRLARAGAMDAVGGRWQMPLPDTVSLFNLPFPRLSGLRQAAYARIAAGIHAFAEGRPDEAELAMREAISMGFLLVDSGYSLIENLIGLIIVENGADALERLYRASGRADEADDLQWARQSAVRAAERVQAGTPMPFSTAAALATIRAMPEVVLDTAALSGVRWEYLLLLNTLAPCMNLNRAVFGPGQEYEDWIESARERLVRYPSEAAIFEAGRSGFFGPAGHGSQTAWYARALSLAMGGHDTPGSCASLLGAIGGGF